MNEEETYDFVKGGIGTALLLCVVAFILSISIVSAWPYSINLSNGEIIDMNVSNNETVNLTIYVYNYTSIGDAWYQNFTNLTQEISWINITNVTNVTCVNCTNNYTNITNQDLKIYNYTIENSNGSYYNKSEIDNAFVTKTNFEGGLNNVITQTNNANTNLNANLNEMNITVTDIQDKNKNKNTILWIVLIVVGLIAILAFWKTSQTGGEE